MIVKTEYDRQGLRAVGGIVASILQFVSESVKPGTMTRSLDLFAEELLLDYGAEATPRREYNFPGCLCISINDEVVHGVPCGRLIEPGDLVKLDLTAEFRGYVADATRCVVVPPVDPEAERLSACARELCHLAIGQARAGTRLEDLGRFIETAARERGVSVYHNLSGHGVGRRTHEEPAVPNYADKRNTSVLRDGSVIAIEPIITAGTTDTDRHQDGWTIFTRDGSLAAHYEETIIVGTDSAEIITRIDTAKQRDMGTGPE